MVSAKIYDKVTILILKLSISHFKMVMFLALHPVESISLNSFVLLVADFNTRNKLLTQKLLKQGYRYHKLYISKPLNFIDDIKI